ncbi:MAG: NUDIX domain-containing protein [Bdellovibrionota bacterium]
MAIELTVDLVILTLREDSLCVLLAKRQHAPFKNHWEIPGRFLREKESLEEAIAAELEEEIGTREFHFEQLHAFGDPKRDPRGRVVAVSAIALVPAGREAASKGGAAEAAWFEVSSLPRLAFDHRKIVQCGVNRLKERVLLSDTVKHFLPEEFTLGELKALSQVVLADRESVQLQLALLKKRKLLEPGKKRPLKGPQRYRFRKKS